MLSCVLLWEFVYAGVEKSNGQKWTPKPPHQRRLTKSFHKKRTDNSFKCFMRRKVKESQWFSCLSSSGLLQEDSCNKYKAAWKKCDVLFKVEDEYSLYWSLVVSKQIISWHFDTRSQGCLSKWTSIWSNARKEMPGIVMHRLDFAFALSTDKGQRRWCI